MSTVNIRVVSNTNIKYCNSNIEKSIAVLNMKSITILFAVLFSIILEYVFSICKCKTEFINHY